MPHSKSQAWETEEERIVWLAAFGARVAKSGRFPEPKEAQRTHDLWVTRAARECADYAVRRFRQARRQK